MILASLLTAFSGTALVSRELIKGQLRTENLGFKSNISFK